MKQESLLDLNHDRLSLRKIMQNHNQKLLLLYCFDRNTPSRILASTMNIVFIEMIYLVFEQFKARLSEEQVKKSQKLYCEEPKLPSGWVDNESDLQYYDHMEFQEVPSRVFSKKYFYVS